ncbi:uncharacterized protein KZ484_011304 [Pholidichthys leucotaenia]
MADRLLIERLNFRQENDAWRHKLFHCVGFENFLAGRFGSELVEDLNLFKEVQPLVVPDWSFDENCLFCCLRRDHIKEHFTELNNERLDDSLKLLPIRDLTAVVTVEKKVEEYINAAFNSKEEPDFSDPHIPEVAQEISRKMIRQITAEYTSKTSPSQDSCSDSQPYSDQSLSTSPFPSGASQLPSTAATLAGPAHHQNPVLSKLLMADQDAPLDLTIKNRDGVLDLSLKKNRSCSSSLATHSPSLSPVTSTLKGGSPDLRAAKAKELQSTSTLEQFMAKLCPHHQRQIVNAIGFLQTEVKAQRASTVPSGNHKTASATAKLSTVTPESFPIESTPKPEIQDLILSVPTSCAIKVPENAVSTALNFNSHGGGRDQGSTTPPSNPDVEKINHSDHAPLKMKIMTSSTPGKKLACLLNAPLSDTLEDKQKNLNPSNRTENARLSPSVKRHSPANHTYHARQSMTVGYAKDITAKQSSLHMTVPSDSTRTARKTVRASFEHCTRDSDCRRVVDPDFGYRDIVFINQPITECLNKHRRGMLPRRNARKSTRGHMYSDESWEVKTVRTLAGRGNCHNPMPELTTPVTPKQILSKPEGVPPVDMPFVVACSETMNQQMPTEESDESIIPGARDIVEVVASKVDVRVETSQTDQCQNKEQSGPRSPLNLLSENKETITNTDVEQDTNDDAGITTEIEEHAEEASFEAIKDNEPEPQKCIQGNTAQITKTVVEMSEIPVEEPWPSNELLDRDPIIHHDDTPSPVSQVQEDKGEEVQKDKGEQVQKDKGEEVQDSKGEEVQKNKGEEVQENKGEDIRESKKEEIQEDEPEEVSTDKNEEIRHEPPQELQVEKHVQHDNLDVTETTKPAGSAGELCIKETEVKPPEDVESMCIKSQDENGDEYVSSKTLELSEELPPWRRKKGTQLVLPKHPKQTRSDRSLRHKASKTPSPIKTPVKSRQNAPKDESTTNNNVLEKHLPEACGAEKSVETSPVKQQVTELSSDTSSPTSNALLRTKKVQKQKRVSGAQDSLPTLSDQPVDTPQSPESKRLLRSATQKLHGTPVSPPTVASVSSPEPSTEQPPCPHPFPSPLPVTSPPVTSPGPTVNEVSQQNTATDSLELQTETNQAVERVSDKIQKNEQWLEARQKLRSTKVVGEDGKKRKQQIVDKVLRPLADLSPVKAEIQAQVMPLRSQRVLRKDVETSDVAVLQKPNVASLENHSANGEDSSCPPSEKSTRMPLRNESSKAEMVHQSVTQLPQVENKKLALRSQKQASPSTSSTARQNVVTSPVRVKQERIPKAQVRSSVSGPCVSHISPVPVTAPRPEPPKPTVNKFFRMLTGEEGQRLITNLNMKYEKMQKGWVQTDKEGQPATKYKNKADRQAAIWKSKRRARKSRFLEHQKWSAVQMLFRTGYNLSNIRRWFLESSETKSLVIVKKVTTRLPSETQLYFHNPSSATGTSQGIFPSMQAERLKKHLKKFAIASPVKSNPKSQKLIAKALEQDASSVKGKERELPSTSQNVMKAHSSAKVSGEKSKSQKSSGKSKNPASARILRKYSNIREKMQVQQTSVRLKDPKVMKSKNIKRLATPKSVTKSNPKPPLKARKSDLPVGKQMKASVAKMKGRKMLAGRKPKHTVQEKAVKAQSSSRVPRDSTKKHQPKRFSQRLGSPKTSEHNPADSSKNKADSKNAEVEKPSANKVNSAKNQMKELPRSTAAGNKGVENAVEVPQQRGDVKTPTSPDQVQTRSQRKMEVAVQFSGSPSHPSKRAKKTMTQTASPKSFRKGNEPAVTRSGALKPPAKRGRPPLLPRIATKLATKKAQEVLETPAKRTRTSLSK